MQDPSTSAAWAISGRPGLVCVGEELEDGGGEGVKDRVLMVSETISGNLAGLTVQLEQEQPEQPLAQLEEQQEQGAMVMIV
ncbi:hypothetical protein N7462_006255 [Penicillium macrosclerotiorum]|uniref:uncharacterized protein n=1 Tax=Penicillium macrosclerotiorum TaxID=303699 RepID=UPI00254874DD|nr:uncharacterized protein N7462_006255 [Penicillium macrosclerotiorum]KAJ5683090.1 hypothetical protein N7462_006255 [Penicillium macrosclerotiorum]